MAAPTKYVYKDGSPFHEGHCCLPDHHVTTVQVTIRSMNPLGLETLRDLIQQKYEVMGLVPTEVVCVVRNPILNK